MRRAMSGSNSGDFSSVDSSFASIVSDFSTWPVIGQSHSAWCLPVGRASKGLTLGPRRVCRAVARSLKGLLALQLHRCDLYLDKQQASQSAASMSGCARGCQAYRGTAGRCCQHPRKKPHNTLACSSEIALNALRVLRRRRGERCRPLSQVPDIRGLLSQCVCECIESAGCKSLSVF